MMIICIVPYDDIVYPCGSHDECNHGVDMMNTHIVPHDDYICPYMCCPHDSCAAIRRIEESDENTVSAGEPMNVGGGGDAPST